MRKMMLSATLMTFAACGSVRDAGMEDPGSGSGSGSADADAGVPTPSGALTMDPGEFIVDGSTWWTNTSAPTLHGTFEGAAGASILVKVNGGVAMAATITGTTWSLALATDAINSSYTPVTVTMTDPAGAAAELSQVIGLDSAPPTIVLGSTSVRDERGDAIDFSSGEPVHTHAGAAVDLSSAGCPGVYKYAYLMDATAPAYGSATSPNDLAWKVRIADAKLEAGSQEFRVRTSDNQILINWGALPAADAAGYSTIKLTRNGGAYPIPALGSRTGQVYIDVRARDWAGQQASSSICFDHHPLAAPVAVTPLVHDELFDMSLVNGAPISMYTKADGMAVNLVVQRVTQQTAEPVTMTWHATAGAMRWSKLAVYDIVPEQVQFLILCNPGATDPVCTTTTVPSEPGEAIESGSMPASLITSVVDDNTGAIVAAGTALSMTWTMPARPAGQPPHSYRVVIATNPAWMLGTGEPYWGGGYGEFDLLGLRYTGGAPHKKSVKCTLMTQTAFGPGCQQWIQYWELVALDMARLDFDPINVSIATSVTAQGATFASAAYVAASSLTTGALTWDAGDPDLPGPQH